MTVKCEIHNDQVMLFNCYDLFCTYENYLNPYIGLYSGLINIEEALMGELYAKLEIDDNPEYNTFTKCIQDIFIPTDISAYFFHTLNSVIDNLIANIIYNIKGRLLIEFIIQPGYTIMAKFMVPRYIHAQL